MTSPQRALFNPPALPAPPGYSQVAIVPCGTLVAIAGQVALDDHGALVGPGDVDAQAIQVFRNLLAALAAAGAEPRHLIKLTTFVTDMAALSAFRAARDRFLDPAHPPTSTLVQVQRLFRPEFLIEIEALAML